MRGTFANLTLLISIFFWVGNIFGGKDKQAEGEQYVTPAAVYNYHLSTKTFEYNTLEECIEAIRKNTGSTLEVITDQPSEITGFLSNGEHFGCAERVSDEKGRYVDGWYTVK